MRSLQMSVSGLCAAGWQPVFDMQREEMEEKKNLNHLHAAVCTLGVPRVPRLIPLYPREAGCQVWEGEA